MNNNSAVNNTTACSTTKSSISPLKKKCISSPFKEIFQKKSATYLVKTKCELTKNRKAHSVSSATRIQQNRDLELPPKQEPIPVIGQNIISFNYDKFAQSHIHLLGPAKSFFQYDDEISRIFKKIVLNFNENRGESHFEIPGGTFKGTSFALRTNGRRLSLNVFHANDRAKSLIIKNQHLLKNRLLRHEIQLTELLFNS